MKSKLLSLVLLLVAPMAFAQQHAVHGAVTDASGESLAGAVVAIATDMTAQPTGAVMVDIDGNYTIDCSENDILVFNYLGMKEQRIAAKGKSVLNVVMQPDASFTLDEAVAIGYGSVRREDLTGSVSNVKMGDIKNVPVSSVDQALQGRVAGADVMSTTGAPGAATTIRIRGTRSITASNEPLIVVDGIMDAVSDLNDINPADIEDISVLKDASSTAIYGSRGANGVILITTKAASAKSSPKPNITFKAEAGLSMLPSTLDIMNGQEFALYRLDYSLWPSYSAGDYNTPLSQRSLSDPFSYGEGTDWIKSITRIAPYQNYYLSVSGGVGKTNYFASVGYNDNEGIVKKSGEKKFSHVMSITYQPFSFMRIGYTMNYSRRHTDSPLVTIGGTGWYDSALYLSPLIGERDTFNPLYNDGTLINTPISVLENKEDYYKRNFFMPSVWIENSLGRFVKWKVQYNLYSYTRERYAYTSSQMPAKQEGAGGDAIREDYGEERHTFETTLSFKRDWMKVHNLDAMAGFTGAMFKTRYFYLQGSGYQVDQMKWNDMKAVVDKNTYSATTYTRMKNNLSALARVNYNYKNRYYLTLTGRADGASNFADNHKWGFFPSGALKWNVHKEDFMKNAHNVDELSIKASAGQTGNDSIGYFVSKAALVSTTGSLMYGQQPIVYLPARIESPDLTWETTTMYNIGVTGRFFNSRLNVSFEAYTSHTDDLLLTVKVPSSTGYQGRYANLGKTTNSGVEFSIDSRNILTGNFEWSSTFTIAHNKQLVKDIGNESFVSTFTSPGTNGYMMMGYVEGYPLNSLWGFTYAGVWHNAEEIERNKKTHTYVSQTAQQSLGTPKYVDVNHDGTLNQSDLCYLGNADPVLYGGLQNNFRYKDLKINMYWTYSMGGKIYNYSMFYMAGGNSTNQYKFMKNAWDPVRNPNSNIPRAGYYEVAVPSDFMVYDASYLRLQNLSIAYTFDLRKTRSHLKDLTLTAAGNNLLLFKKYNGFDPDVSSSGTSSTVRRMDVGAYPKARTIVFSVQIRY